MSCFPCFSCNEKKAAQRRPRQGLRTQTPPCQPQWQALLTQARPGNHTRTQLVKFLTDLFYEIKIIMIIPSYIDIKFDQIVQLIRYECGFLYIVCRK